MKISVKCSDASPRVYPGGVSADSGYKPRRSLDAFIGDMAVRLCKRACSA
jgi:hypothetical protein